MAKTTALLGLAVAGIGLILLLSRPGNALASALESAGLNPDTFTASIIQLDALEAAGYPNGSDIYQKAIDFAYAKALADALEFCGDSDVSWTSVRGYFATCLVLSI